jgi:hypothetical protein
MTNAEITLRSCIIRAWTDGSPCTQAALAKACTAAGEPVTQPQVGIYFTKWSKAGICETQTTVRGRPGAAYIFNWTGAPVDSVNLSDVARQLLVDPDGNLNLAEHARKVRTGLRYALGVSETGTDQALLTECANVSARELHALPGRVFEAALEHGSKRNAGNCTSAVRRMLREAAEAGAIAVVLEKNWEEDEWTEARDRYFGAACGRLTQRLRGFRCHWNHYAEGAKSLERVPSGPEAVTPAMVEEICSWHWEQGRTYLRNQLKNMLKWVARTHKEGPYAAYVGDDSATWTHNGWRNPGRLLLAKGRAGTGDWSSLLQMVDEAGFPEEWVDFLEWYGEFLTLDFDEIERQADRFPTQPPRWGLKRTTLVKRIINIRTLLYHAPVVLGKPASEISLQDFLGDSHRRVLAHLRTWWAGRARDAADPVSSPNSDGLEKLVLAYGLIAYAQHLRLRHDRNAAPEVPEDHRLSIQQGATMTDPEKKLFEAYRAASSHAKKIQKDRRRESAAFGDNTVRDLPRLIGNTDAAFWIALLDEMIRQVRAQVELSAEGQVLKVSAENQHTFFKLVGDAYYHGWLISTGMRICETGHVRLDVQYSPELRSGTIRQAHLRAVDRKDTPNTLPHQTAVRDRYVPGWLEELYLAHARPFFMQTWPALKGHECQSHEWLFVDAKGRPYGCAGEAADGGDRDSMAFNSRLTRLRLRWQARCARVAAGLGRRLPALPRESANHAVRIAMGYQIRQELGLTAAANYLGDKEGSVENVYAGVSGLLVDSSVLAGEYVDWPLRGNEKPASSALRVEALKKRLDDVTARFSAGEIDYAAYLAASSRLERALADAA